MHKKKKKSHASKRCKWNVYVCAQEVTRHLKDMWLGKHWTKKMLRNRSSWSTERGSGIP